MPAFIRIAWKVIFDAVWHFSEDDGWAMASHVALSTLLAIFPFLIFGTALGSFLGADQFASTAVHFIFDTWPESIAKPIADEVVQVLTIPRGGLAHRLGAGRRLLRLQWRRGAADLAQPRLPRRRKPALVHDARCQPRFRARRRAGACHGQHPARGRAARASAMPAPVLPWFNNLLDHARQLEPCRRRSSCSTVRADRQPSVAAGRHRKIIDVLPGIILTLIAWSIGAYIFASYLATFANYVSTYAGLASIMIALVFLYMVGVDLHHRRGDQCGDHEIQGQAHAASAASGAQAAQTARAENLRKVSYKDHRPDIPRRLSCLAESPRCPVSPLLLDSLRPSRPSIRR